MTMITPSYLGETIEYSSLHACRSTLEDPTSETDLSVIQTLADFAAIALDNARHLQRIHELTIVDERTGLYNSRHLNFILDTEIYRCQRYSYEFSLVAIGLEDLKKLAESLSYMLFDELVIQIAAALNGPTATSDTTAASGFGRTRGLLRLIDYAFRYGVGGETEFYLLLPQTGNEDARLFARRLHKFFSEMVWLKEAAVNIRLRASVAVATYPSDSESKQGLLSCLDEALQLAKRSGRGVAVAANGDILAPL